RRHTPSSGCPIMAVPSPPKRRSTSPPPSAWCHASPVRSPESNGIAEAFVKTFKRDYARIHPLPDAATVLRQIARWVDDYNESHPHSGLGMISRREFIRAQAT